MELGYEPHQIDLKKLFLMKIGLMGSKRKVLRREEVIRLG